MTSRPRPYFFDVIENVKQYIEMCDGMDGRDLVEILRNHLKPHSTVLELGMGPGKDLDILREYFVVTGSDSSGTFIDLYKGKDPEADLLRLDAVTLETKRRFDCIYSNKVLHHLKREELPVSFERQHNVLNDCGIMFHSFWKGSKEEEFEDLKFIQYERSELEKMTNPFFNLVESGMYAEMNKNDSIYLVLQKK